jgi:hypothetical protein
MANQQTNQLTALQLKLAPEFINTPLSQVMRDHVFACSIVPDGVESYSVKDMVLQSIFLKMAGVFEQKRAYLVHDIERLNGGRQIDELHKTGIYKKIIKIVYKRAYNEISNTVRTSDQLQDQLSPERRQQMIQDARQEILDNLLISPPIRFFDERYFNDIQSSSFVFLRPGVKLSENMFCVNATNLLTGELLSYYDNTIYTHRNRLAHNAYSKLSIEDRLTELTSPTEYFNTDHFTMFIVLNLLDKIFITLYNIHQKL